MSILDQLSSQSGDLSEGSNRKVAGICLQNPDLLSEIAEGLKEKNAALAGDCAEVMTLIAEIHPEWTARYSASLAGLLSHKNTRVRWEAVHSLALTAREEPVVIEPILPALAGILRGDASIIVRDYATDAVANYASAGEAAAEAAYPLLKEMLSAWNGKHAGHALNGLIHVAEWQPSYHDELISIAEQFSNESRAVVRKAARDLLNRLKDQSSRY
jgi:HEAT repeat protein